MTTTRMRYGSAVMGALCLGAAWGCHELTGSQTLPAGTHDPSFYNTPSGAVSLRNGAIYLLETEIPFYVTNSGLLTDELESNQTGASAGQLLIQGLGTGGSLDERILPELTTGSGPADNDYVGLQGVRGAIAQALGTLAAYDTAAADTAAVKVMRGELYALDGYAEILLADFFCSGIPLSTVDFQRDYTYAAGSMTQQVYQDAITKEDSALALAGARDSVTNLARVLKGRALLDLGDFAQAGQVVADVPDDFQYTLAIQWAPLSYPTVNILNSTATVSDSEGSHGVPFVSSHDPRVSLSTLSCPSSLNGCPSTLYFPGKYSNTGYSRFTVTSGIEARLIQAEAALQQGDVATWLATLNTLRTDGTNTPVPPDTLVDTLGVTGCVTGATCGQSPAGNAYSQGQPAGYPPFGYVLAIADTTYPAPTTPIDIKSYCSSHSFYKPCSRGDTMVVARYVNPAHVQWHAGIGGVTGLAPLTDPGTPAGRVALLFRERAWWLFLTGQRQGDLRRLVQEYGQREDQVYPVGPYFAPGAGQYGADVTAPIPAGEYTNPLFHGCLNRD